MANQELKITIGGDPTGAVKAFDLIKNKVSDFSNNLSRQFSSFSGVLDDFTSDIAEAGSPILGLVGGLIGAGGVAFAATAASSAILQFADQIIFSSQRARESAQVLGLYTQKLGQTTFDTDKAKKALEEYNKIVDGVIKTTTSEASRVSLIVDRLQEGNLKRNEQIALIKELQKIAPDYFGNLDAEKAKINDVALAYQNYNNSLVKSIEAQIKTAQLTDVINKRLAAQQANPESAAFINQLLKSGKSLEDIVTDVANEQLRTAKVLTDAAKTGKIISDQKLDELRLTKLNTLANTDILNLLLEEKNLLESINNTDLKKIGISYSELTSKLKGQTKELKTQASVIQSIFDARAKIPNAIKAVGSSNIENTTVALPTDQFTNEAAKKKAEEIRAYFQQLQDALKSGQDAIRLGVVEAFTSIGESFGVLLTDGIGGALKLAGQSLLRVVGGVLQEVGKQMIVASKLVITLQKTLSSLFTNPAAGLAVGVGLVALGSILKNIQLTKVKPFAEGGIVTGPTLGLVGEAGKEAIIPLDRIGEVLGSIGGAQTVFVRGEISGRNLEIVSSRQQKSNQRFT